MDEMDRQIVNLLRADGRRSNVEIARELGVSEGTVRKRVDRLLGSSTLRIVGLADPASVGLKVRTLIFVTAELARLQSIGQSLCQMPEVLSVYLMTGEYDLVLEAAFESDEHLMSFLRDRVATIPGVMATKTGHVPLVMKQQHEWAIPEPPPPTILIVDDDPDFIEYTRLVLESEGYVVWAAHSGQAALQSMASTVPDLVIMDIMMDGVFDGWDANRRMRQDPRLRDTPILVVSSITASDYLGQLPTDDDNLIDNFLSKPVDPAMLKTEVRRLVGRKQLWWSGRLR
jgi:Lrp/AsnC family transcriptional regulator for asnA, asnC and gidA